MGDLSAHYKDDCSLHPIQCSHRGCNQKQPRKNMRAIHSQLCSQRILSCQHCGKNFTCKELKDHLKVCENYPIKCEVEECNAMVPRNQMSTHRTKDCMFTIVSCEWYDFGCDHKMMKKDLKNHHSDSIVKHLDCVKNVITKILDILPKDQVKRALSDLNVSKNVPPPPAQNSSPSSSWVLSTPTSLSSTTANESFELHSNDVTDEQLLQELPPQHNKLKKLNLKDCMKLTDLSITKIAQNYTQLQHLDLVSCTQITDKSIVQLSQNCTQLQILRLSRCTQITDNSIIQISQNCKQLKFLNVAGCQEITNDAIVQVSQNCKQLNWLDVARCHQITDKSIIQLSQNSPLLQILGLSRCAQITDNSVIQISQNCKQMRELYLWGCNQITNNSIVQLSQNCKQLQILSLGDCTQISDECVISMVKNCVELHALFLNNCFNVSNALKDELKTLGIKIE